MVTIRPPQSVDSPKDRLKHMRVVQTTTYWALAIGIWDNNPALLIRWNGDADRPLGNPVSSANPTWFVLPDDLWWPVLGGVENLQERVKAIDWLRENLGPEGAAKG